MTLVANSVRGAARSPASTASLSTRDEGRTDSEYLSGTLSGTSVTDMMRGIDPATGTTSNGALKFARRVDSDIKITDFLLLQILRNQVFGYTSKFRIDYYDKEMCGGSEDPSDPDKTARVLTLMLPGDW